MATKIKIKNIGPIKEADLDLNKINMFMGQQSSGKSTIAKIISYCTWVEKDVATAQSLSEYQSNGYFKEHLEKYHKLKGYFKQDSLISYSSDVLAFEYDSGKFTVSWKDQYAYKRSKISYIPSERNMVILPEIEQVKFGDINIKDFLSDWVDARKSYEKSGKLSILELGMGFYYDEGAKENHILHKDNGDSYDILLDDASSGLQSLTPLISTIDYLTNRFYIQEEKTSSILDERKKQTNNILTEELILRKYFTDHNREKWNDEIKAINEKLQLNDKDVKPLYDYWKSIRDNLFSTHNSQFIIEEPEQNLFPETQRDLVYHLLRKCVNNEREHRLTITTHSPYILYAMNNCMLGGLVADRMTTADKAKLKCEIPFINPNDVSIYEIHDGILLPTQQDDGLISQNYFDAQMKELMDDFYVMLNYYGND